MSDRSEVSVRSYVTLGAEPARFSLLSVTFLLVAEPRVPVATSVPVAASVVFAESSDFECGPDVTEFAACDVPADPEVAAPDRAPEDAESLDAEDGGDAAPVVSAQATPWQLANATPSVSTPANPLTHPT
jgi:hypothetical protein